MEYRFYDFDSVTEEEFDITGEDYIELMKLCIKYSKTVCFRKFIHFQHYSSIPEQLEKYRLPINEKTMKPYYDNYGPFCFEGVDEAKKSLYLFELSNEVCEWILSAADNIWDWYRGSKRTLIEDPVFFREDGSVFFDSIIHEGVIYIHPIDGEDVSTVVSKGHWHCIED